MAHQQSSLHLIGQDCNYSSWTLRPLLLLEHAGIPYKLECFHDHPDSQQERDRIRALSLSGLVPVLLLPHPKKDRGQPIAINDSLAIVETISDLYPEKFVWPKNSIHRALARAACAEMHSGFGELRSKLPCNLRKVVKARKELDEKVSKDVDRICAIWENARSSFLNPELNEGGAEAVPDDGWLFGQFTAADAFYIVVASRFRTYRVDISSERYPLAKLYYERIWTDEAVKRVVNRAVENKVWMLDHYEAYLGEADLAPL